MIAWAGLERLRLGLVDGLDAAAAPALAARCHGLRAPRCGRQGMTR